MKRWEYKFVDIRQSTSQDVSEKEFAQLGREGWELTATYTVTETRGGQYSIAVFKREL